ncbi:stress responsive A/B barrel domain-containing protein [Xylaria cf. heliscus]|nr:stress responsive A/B barrel domain-containing protein [Xylaria cf. heliscus]
MPINHIVLLRFKPTVDAEGIKQFFQEMISLKDTCLHPKTQKPYIRSLSCGKDNSINGLQDGFEYGIVVEFENEEDRDFYTTTDESHKALAATSMELLEKVIVVDYAF